MSLLHYAIMAYALTYLITESSIFAVPRVLASRGHVVIAMLMYCPACMGFWVGVCLGVAGWFPFDTPHPVALEALNSGLVSMAICSLISKMTGGNPAWESESALRGDNDA
jgi:hypothetical protein